MHGRPESIRLKRRGATTIPYGIFMDSPALVPFSCVAAYEFRQVEPLGCLSYLVWLVGYQLCVTLLYLRKLENELGAPVYGQQ